MALAETQKVLAQLYTNVELRNRFFDDPRAVGVTLGLTVDEAAQIAQMSGSQISQFARSLRRKRLDDIGKRFPITRQHLGHRFGELFERFLQLQTFGDSKTLNEELHDFAAFLETSLHSDVIDDDLRECLRYEAAWLRASRPGPCLIVRRFQFESRDLNLDAKVEKTKPSKRNKKVWMVWFRLAARQRLRHFNFSWSRGAHS